MLAAALIIKHVGRNNYILSEQELSEAIKQKVSELNELVDKLKGTEMSVWFSQVMPMQGVNHNPLEVTMSKTTVF